MRTAGRSGRNPQLRCNRCQRVGHPARLCNAPSPVAAAFMSTEQADELFYEHFDCDEDEDSTY